MAPSIAKICQGTEENFLTFQHTVVKTAKVPRTRREERKWRLQQRVNHILRQRLIVLFEKFLTLESFMSERFFVVVESKFAWQS